MKTNIDTLLYVFFDFDYDAMQITRKINLNKRFDREYSVNIGRQIYRYYRSNENN